MGSQLKIQARQRRIRRVRSRIDGTAKRPRLAVSFSNRRVVAQLIDDVSAKTLAYASSPEMAKGSLTVQAVAVANELAKQAKAVKITKAILDRRHKPYHGRVKAFAEAVRKQGLEV